MTDHNEPVGSELPNYLKVMASHHAAMVMCLSTIQMECGNCFRLMQKETVTEADGVALMNAINRINSIASDLSDTLMIQ